MDLKLSNYEVIYETLSASESDSEANESADNCASSCRRKENRARRKIMKNFIICQPMDLPRFTISIHINSTRLVKSSSRRYSAQKKLPNKQLLSKANNAVSEEYNLGFSKGKFQKEEEKRKDWSNVVNFVGSCGPSMNTIEKVIEETVYRVLNEDLPSKFSGKAGIVGTIENCPDCNFSTLSKFLYKKHVALHENKPHLVFSQNVSGNSLNQFQSNLKQEFYQCPHCSDLFRTDTAMKYHKCVVTMLSAGSSGMQASGVSTNKVAGDKYGGTALECALKFLNQKPIDMEIAKEQVVPLVFNKDQFMQALIDNKIDKLEKSVEELNKTVKAQNNFNVYTSNKLQGPEKQNIKQERICANDNNSFFTSQIDAVHAKYLCKILEEPIDNKEETKELNGDCKHSFCRDEKNILVLKGLNTQPENVEEIRKNTGNNTICDRTYDDLEKTMAILTGEGNSNDKGLLKHTDSGIDLVNKTTLTSSNFKDVLNAENNDIKSNNENKDKRLATSKKQTSHSCKLCDRVFKKHSSLKAHEHDEHFPDYFLCRLCDYKSKIKIDLKKHYRKKHYDTYVRIFLK